MKGIGLTFIILLLIGLGTFLGLSQSNIPENTLSSDLRLDGAQSYILSSGDRIHYQTLGHGPPVILLAPFVLQVWDPVFTELARSFRVTRVSLPGVGLSFYGDRLSSEKVIRDVGALLQHLGIRDLRIVGYDSGAAVAYALQSNPALRVQKVVLISPRGVPQTNRDPMSFLADSFLGQMSSMPVMRFYNHLRFKPQSWQDDHDKWLYYSMNSDKEKFYDYFKISESVFRTLVPLVAQGYLLWGEENRIFPSKYAKLLAQRLGVRSVKLYPDQGHALVEVASKEFIQDLVTFLR